MSDSIHRVHGRCSPACSYHESPATIIAQYLTNDSENLGCSQNF